MLNSFPLISLRTFNAFYIINQVFHPNLLEKEVVAGTKTSFFVSTMCPIHILLKPFIRVNDESVFNLIQSVLVESGLQRHFYCHFQLCIFGKCRRVYKYLKLYTTFFLERYIIPHILIYYLKCSFSVIDLQSNVLCLVYEFIAQDRVYGFPTSSIIKKGVYSQKCS